MGSGYSGTLSTFSARGIRAFVAHSIQTYQMCDIKYAINNNVFYIDDFNLGLNPLLIDQII